MEARETKLMLSNRRESALMKNTEREKERGAVLYISVQMNSALWPTSAGWMSEHLSLNPTKNNDDSSYQHRQAHKTGGERGNVRME